MSLSINCTHVAGRLTRDPQVRTVGADRAVANFSIAINERWKDKDGQPKEQTTFLDVSAWGRTAELVGQYLTKGSGCYVQGKLRTESWEGKDGEKKSKLVLIADTVQFTDAKGERAAPQDDAPAAAPASAQARAPQVPKPVAGKGAAVEDEIPFARFDP
ncbi:MAG: single-stranded DNA-binding protein [Planctomycetes bacterium]|nr:single-stranded DNA-binding protein [Planctomycetota bacterium]